MLFKIWQGKSGIIEQDLEDLQASSKKKLFVQPKGEKVENNVLLDT